MHQEFNAIGNLGNEPEMRYLADGTPVTSFRMAINERWTTAGGEAKESTLWVKVTTWRKKAEVVSQYLHKGSKVFIKGKLKPPSAYTAKNGELAATIEVTADEVIFLDGKPQDGANGHAPAVVSQGNNPDIPF